MLNTLKPAVCGTNFQIALLTNVINKLQSLKPKQKQKAYCTKENRQNGPDEIYKKKEQKNKI